MSEKEIEALQKNARRWNRAASVLFAVVWLGLTAALLAFSLYVSAQEGISLQLELIAASVTLPLVAAFGLYLLLYFLLKKQDVHLDVRLKLVQLLDHLLLILE